MLSCRLSSSRSFFEALIFSIVAEDIFLPVRTLESFLRVSKDRGPSPFPFLASEIFFRNSSENTLPFRASDIFLRESGVGRFPEFNAASLFFVTSVWSPLGPQSPPSVRLTKSIPSFRTVEIVLTSSSHASSLDNPTHSGIIRGLNHSRFIFSIQ